MKKSVSRFILLLVLCSVVVSLPKINTAEVEPKAIVVPDDYPTISSAIGNATDGDTVFVKKGTYEEETLVINKTISLIGENANNTKINLHPPLITTTIFTQTITYYASPIRIDANDVKLSGFTITSDGGWAWIPANRTQITGNIITIYLQVEGSHSTIAGNTFTQGVSCHGSYSKIFTNNLVGPRGIGVGSFSVVYGNNVTGTSNNLAGIAFGGEGTVIAHNTITNCSNGVATYGRKSINNKVYANRITNNTQGIVLTEGNNNTFYANYVAGNSWGASIGFDAPRGIINTLYHNNFVDNTHQVNINKTGMIGRHRADTLYHTGNFDNGKEGNYWSDYTGKDSNGDGIGDTPYIIDKNRQDRYPLMEPYVIPPIVIAEFPDITPPIISIVSPENKTYTVNHVSLNFTVSETTSWIGYSLDGQAIVTIAGNTTLSGLPGGSHSLVVYARDTAGYTGASETNYFSIAQKTEPEQSEPFPITWIVTATAIIAIGGVVILVYFRKIKKTTRKAE